MDNEKPKRGPGRPKGVSGTPRSFIPCPRCGPGVKLGRYGRMKAVETQTGTRLVRTRRCPKCNHVEDTIEMSLGDMGPVAGYIADLLAGRVVRG